MADSKITQLPSASVATANNVLPIVQGGVTDQITVTNLGNGIFQLNLPLTSSGITLSGDIVPATPQGANLGSPSQPFREIYLQSGSISIESNIPGNPSTVISNTAGNLLISAGGMQLLGSGSFNAVTGSFQYITGSINQVGNYTITGSLNTTGDIKTAGELWSTFSSGDEGGQLNLALSQTGNSLTQSITFDVYTNKVRLFEAGGTNRGGYWDISTLAPGVGTNFGAFYSPSNFGFYGAFCSTGSQTNPSPNISRSMQLETTEISNGVSIVSGSRITVANPGVYNLQFSAQLEKTDNGVDTVYIWFKKNGTNVPRSATSIDVLKQSGGSGRFVAAWNYVDNLAANDYIEIIWQSDDINMQLAFDPASGNYPAIPSVIATLTQVS